MEQQFHVAILSSPGTGHLIPLIEFAKVLFTHHNLTSTIIAFSDFSSPSQPSLLSSLPPSISSLSLPSLPLPSLPSDSCIETRISTLIALSVPSLTLALQTLKSSTNLIAYIIDLFGLDTLPTAKELGIPAYMFCTSNLFFLSFMLHLPTLDETTSCEFRNLPEPLHLPGCVPLDGSDFLYPLQDRSKEAYRWVVHLAERYRDVEGILVNSFEALEPASAKVFSNRQLEGTPHVYPIGPIFGSDSTEKLNMIESLRWLDLQPRGSVLFVNFGSGGTLSCEQFKELALGLQESKQRFLWVVRAPSDFEPGGSYFGFENKKDPLEFLPEEFLTRTKDLGLVVANWAPQIEVLGHVAVGGFVTHCGWNSILESTMNRVPMIAWPLYAEQRMNAVMLVEGMKLALRPIVDETGLVKREEISMVIKELMEGEKGKIAGDNAGKMKEAGVKALEKDGSSYRALAEVVNRWTSTYAM